LKPKQAADVISNLAPDKQAEVARRIAKMEGTSPEVIKEVEKVFEKKLSALMTEDYTQAGGVDAIVEILNSVDRTTEKHIIETLEADDIELAEEIRRRMFVFEDMLMLSNRDIQQVLKEVDNKELGIALKGCTEELKAHLLGNLSKRLAAMIQEDMDFLGPIRRADMEEAQQRIVNIVRRLQESGEIIVARGGSDDIVL
jgi:flagellar motor switch protein FliG